ncbi:MAG: hypothetical protein WD045_02840 [Pirellulaceae bacterium]
MTHLITRWFLFAALVPLVLGGCSLLNEPSKEPSRLPKQKLASDTVVLEIARLPLSGQDDDALAEAWEVIDEQFLAVDARRNLEENGFRVGLIDFHLPSSIRHIFDREEGGSQGLNGETAMRVDGEELPVVNSRRFPRGKRGEYIVVNTRPLVTVLHKRDGVLRGNAYHDAECKFVIRAFPQNDGRVEVEIVPEIQHGQPRQHFAGTEGMFKMETHKQRESMEQLTIRAKMTPGQTLILAGTEPLKGPGQAFFERQRDGTSRRHAILIRLAGSQFDDLFQETDSFDKKDAVSPESTELESPSDNPF